MCLLIWFGFTLIFEPSVMEKERDNTDNKRNYAHRSDFNARNDPIKNQNRTEYDADYV
jgi:hypothetical protein